MKCHSLFNRAVGMTAVGVWMATTAQAVLTFSFDYAGSVEFNDSTGGIGAIRMASLESAAGTVGSWFGHTATIDMKVSSLNTSSGPDGGLLASAGSGYSASSSFRGYINSVVGDKILSNGVTDANGAQPDGQLEVNFVHDWDYDDSISPTAFDFKSTMIHELLHAVGFTSLIEQNGKDIFSSTDENGTNPSNSDPDGGIWAKFDDFLTDSSGNPIIDDATAIIDQSLWDTASLGGTSPGAGLFFDGPNAKAANGGNPVGLYSPTTWENGSSGSHLDTDNAAFADSLMSHSTEVGPGERTLSAIEVGVLTDLGFTIIPEPSSATLLVGAGLLFLGRRQRPSRKSMR